MVPGPKYLWCLVLVILIAPACAFADTTPTPKDTGSIAVGGKLSWTATTGATYEVKIGAVDANNNATLADVVPAPAAGATSVSPQNLTAGQKYQWEVLVTVNGHATTAGPWTFTVTAAAADSSTCLTGNSSDSASMLCKVGFGVAVGLQWNIAKPDIVTDASVDANGIVRVNTRANTTPGFMLETHYLPYQHKFNTQDFGVGPFVAIQPGGTGQIISAVGAGIILDWRPHNALSIAGRTGFGLGIGYESIPAAKTLGDEFVANQPAPTNSSGQPLPIRFQTRDKGSLLLVLSLTF